MFTRALLLILGIFHAANGLVMLALPRQWASSVVHAAALNHLEFHFIADIGMAFLASGVALIWSARHGRSFAPWAIAGAAWPALHALIHVREWTMMGMPATTTDMLNEGIGVILVGVAGVVAAWLRQRQGDTT
jgi:hypothetical protein